VLTLVTGAPFCELTAMPRRVARVAGLVLGLAGCLACERKAPGPEECLQFADAWMRNERFERHAQLARENAWGELVARCLTAPYDRELVSCVVSGAPRERCRIDFERRLEARH
jgi:hypothetical protein